MKYAVPAFAALSVALALAAGCTGTPAQTQFHAPEEALTDCRDYTPPGATEAQHICGTPEQWAELDRRTQLVEAGVTCREMLTGSSSNVLKTLCFTPEGWEEFEREQAAATSDQIRNRGTFGGRNF